MPQSDQPAFQKSQGVCSDKFLTFSAGLPEDLWATFSSVKDVDIAGACDSFKIREPGKDYPLVTVFAKESCLGCFQEFC